MKSRVICIDFDGTCTTHSFPRVGQEIGAVPVLKDLVDAGHKLVLWTMRSDKPDGDGASDEYPHVTSGNFLTDAVKWFQGHKIPLYGVQCNPTQDKWTSSPKAYAQLYIDDCALGIPLVIPKEPDRPFVDWIRVRRLLEQEGYLE